MLFGSWIIHYFFYLSFIYTIYVRLGDDEQSRVYRPVEAPNHVICSMRLNFGLEHKQFQRWTKHEDISQKSYFEANDTKSNILWDSLQQNSGGLYAKLVDRALFFWVY